MLIDHVLFDGRKFSNFKAVQDAFPKIRAHSLVVNETRKRTAEREITFPYKGHTVVVVYTGAHAARTTGPKKPGPKPKGLAADVQRIEAGLSEVAIRKLVSEGMKSLNSWADRMGREFPKAVKELEAETKKLGAALAAAVLDFQKSQVRNAARVKALEAAVWALKKRMAEVDPD